MTEKSNSQPYAKHPQLLVATTIAEVSHLSTSSADTLTAISSWIDNTNAEEERNRRPETMKPRSPEKLRSYLEEGKAVVVFERKDNELTTPVGFCALSYEFPQRDGETVYELGTLIKSPQTQLKGVGISATIATLQLPRSQSAEAIVAYANRNSLPLFTTSFEKRIGVGARVIPGKELEIRFPYLPEYSEDTIIDLTPVRDVVNQHLPT